MKLVPVKAKTMAIQTNATITGPGGNSSSCTQAGAVSWNAEKCVDSYINGSKVAICANPPGTRHGYLFVNQGVSTYNGSHDITITPKWNPAYTKTMFHESNMTEQTNCSIPFDYKEVKSIACTNGTLSLYTNNLSFSLVDIANQPDVWRNFDYLVSCNDTVTSIPRATPSATLPTALSAASTTMQPSLLGLIVPAILAAKLLGNVFNKNN